jgi:hypothetical protein
MASATQDSSYALVASAPSESKDLIPKKIIELAQEAIRLTPKDKVVSSASLATADDETYAQLSETEEGSFLPSEVGEDTEGGEDFYPLNEESCSYYNPCLQYTYTHRSGLPRSILSKSFPPITIRERGPWRGLPKPNMNLIEQQRRGRYQEYNRDESTISRQERNVTFDFVHVRFYQRTIGDNPAVSYGTPIQLEWLYEEELPMGLDEYEGIHRKRRVPRQFVLNHYQRCNILSYYCGFTDDEIKKARRQVEKVKRERQVTKLMVKAMLVEDFLESTARKVKRLIKGGR